VGLAIQVWREFCFCFCLFFKTAEKFKSFFVSFNLIKISGYSKFVFISQYKGTAQWLKRTIFAHFHHAEFSLIVVVSFINSMNCGTDFLNTHAGHLSSHWAVSHTEDLRNRVLAKDVTSRVDLKV